MSPSRGPSCRRSQSRPQRNRTIQTTPPKRCRRGPPKRSFLSKGSGGGALEDQEEEGPGPSYQEELEEGPGGGAFDEEDAHS